MPSVTKPFLINTTRAGDQRDVSFTALASGAVVAVWTTNDPVNGPGSSIMAQMFTHTGEKIGGEFKVNTERAFGPGESAGSVVDPYYQVDADVAALSDGGFIVVYRDTRSSYAATDAREAVLRSVFVAQRYDQNGAKVGTDATITPAQVAETGNTSPYSALSPNIVGLPDGGFVVTAHDSGPWDKKIFGADIDGGIVLSAYTDTASVNKFGLADRKAFAPVNTLQSGSQRFVISEAQLDGNGAPTDRLIHLWETTAFPFDGIPYGSQLRAQVTSSLGQRIGPEVIIPRLAQFDGKFGEAYDMAPLPGGGFIVVWQQNPTTENYLKGIRADIVFQIFNADGVAQGQPTYVQPPDAEVQSAPSVAALPNGTILITWVGDAGAGGVVRGQLYTPSGIASGDIFAISDVSTPGGSRPEAFATLGDTFYVGWEETNNTALGGQSGDIVGAVVDPGGSTVRNLGVQIRYKVNQPDADLIKEGDTGTSFGTFVVQFDRPLTNEVKITYQISPYSGKDGRLDPADPDDMGYGNGPFPQPYQGTVTFTPGNFDANQTLFEIPILPILGDTRPEANEFFSLKLIAATGGAAIADNPPLIYQIVDDDTTVAVPIPVTIRALANWVEGSFDPGGAPGVNEMAFEVVLDRASATVQTVRWSVADRPANLFNSDAGDFQGGRLPGGTLTFAAGETRALIKIPYLADNTPEGTENFTVQMTELSSGLTYGDGSGEAYIIVYDDDAAPTTPTVAGNTIIGTAQGETIIVAPGVTFVDAGLGPDIVIGGASNEFLSGGGDIDFLDGGAGIDRAMAGALRADLQVTIGASKTTVTDALTGDVDTLVNIERLQTGDGVIALDIALPGQGASNAGSAYRMYEAAFNRTPDNAGLAFWIKYLDSGQGVRDAAQGFIGSQEFRDVYGADPSAAQLVTGFYRNILGREPEQGGFDFWFGILNGSPEQRANVLQGIADSQENQNGLISIIGQGIFLPGNLLD